MLHPTAACALWCTDHDDADPADAICQTSAASPAFGEIIASHTGDHGTTIALYNTRDELNLDDAEAYFSAGLALVARARIGVAA